MYRVKLFDEAIDSIQIRMTAVLVVQEILGRLIENRDGGAVLNGARRGPIGTQSRAQN
jgi:hypothetical protein